VVPQLPPLEAPEGLLPFAMKLEINFSEARFPQNGQTFPLSFSAIEESFSNDWPHALHLYS